MGIQLYFTYDCEDIELINLLIDALSKTDIFGVFLSPLSLPGTVPSLSKSMEEHIERCNLLIALFTRTGTRSVLVKREIDLARRKNKIVVPLYETSAKLHRIGDIVGDYLAITFRRRTWYTALEGILSRVSSVRVQFGVTKDDIRRARRIFRKTGREHKFRVPWYSKVPTFRRISIDRSI